MAFYEEEEKIRSFREMDGHLAASILGCGPNNSAVELHRSFPVWQPPVCSSLLSHLPFLTPPPAIQTSATFPRGTYFLPEMSFLPLLSGGLESSFKPDACVKYVANFLSSPSTNGLPLSFVYALLLEVIPLINCFPHQIGSSSWGQTLWKKKKNHLSRWNKARSV